MIHYHGTPIGGTRQDVARFLQGRHALVSFFRPDDIGAVIEYCQTFVLDNGAFSVWKSGNGEVDFNAYSDFVKDYQLHPSLDWCLIPDKIDGTEEENKNLILKWMDIGVTARSIPIYHMHESFDYLQWMISNFDFIAIGSSGQWSAPNSRSWWNRISEIMNICCDDKGRPRVKLHGLRMLNPDIFTRLPLSSADSTNAAVNCGSLSRFGMYKPPTASQRADVIASRIEFHNSSSIYIRNNQTDLILFGGER